MSKLTYYTRQLKEWFKNPTHSFCPSKTFKVSFIEKSHLFNIKDYLVVLVESGIKHEIPITIHSTNNTKRDCISVMKSFIEYYNSNITNAAISTVCI